MAAAGARTSRFVYRWAIFRVMNKSQLAMRDWHSPAASKGNPSERCKRTWSGYITLPANRRPDRPKLGRNRS